MTTSALSNLTQGRRALIARHAQEIETAVDDHRARMASLMERQRLELIELMLVEDTRQKPHDVIELLRAQFKDWMEGEYPCSAEYADAEWLLRILNSFEADTFPPLAERDKSL